MSKKVIDVSAWNGTVDWSKCKNNGVKGAIIKIIRKDLALDQQFTKNYKGCHKHKIPWGVYNYSYATTTAKAKSDMALICDKLDKLDKTYFTLGVWFDLEDKCQAALTKTQIANILNAAQKVVEDRGYKFGVYTGMAFYKEHIDNSKVNCKNWWIARYYKGYDAMHISSTPNASYKPAVIDNLMAWQYTSSGVIADGAGTGNSNHFDLNVLYRDFPADTKTDKKEGNPPYKAIHKTSGKAKVKWLQKKLNANVAKITSGKMDKLAVDGIWGSKTQNALYAYWTQLGWKRGSYAGEKTCKALYKGRKK